MKIFADHCVANFFVEALRNQGFSVERAYEAKLHRSSDEQIFAHAQSHSQVLVSFDRDFANILRFDIPRSHGIAIFEIEGLSRETIAERMVAFFKSPDLKKIKGKIKIVHRSGKISCWP